jgi:hypothetical protein
MEYKKVKKLESKRAIVLLNNGKEHFGKIRDVTPTELRLEMPTDLSPNSQVVFILKDIKNIYSREYVTFLEPKFSLSKTSDAEITRQIEIIKKEKEFSLQTRKYKEQNNGTHERSKWSAAEFETVVAKWLLLKQPLEICPFALVKVKEEEFLLGVDRGHNVRKINQKGITLSIYNKV